MKYSIEFCASGEYELDHKPTKEEIEEFMSCFISDLLDGYIEISHNIYSHFEDEDE